MNEQKHPSNGNIENNKGEKTTVGASALDESFKLGLPVKKSAYNTFDYYDCGDLCESWPLSVLIKESGAGTQTFASDEDPELQSASGALQDKRAVLGWAVELLLLSPSARKLLREAGDQGWSVALESLTRGENGPDFHIDVPEMRIMLDDQDLMTSSLGQSVYFKNALLVSFIRALRDVWQEKRHGAFDIDYGPEEVLMLERVRAADLDILVVLIAWELRGEGQGTLWRHLIGSADGDLAMRFSGHLERDPTSQFNGQALAAVFKQWFRDEHRINTCDHETLNYLDCAMQDSGTQRPFGVKKLTPVGVEILSCLPDKTAYLRGQGGDILSNPLYAGLCDEINQAHFMQIMYDLKVTRVQSVPFRDKKLAEKIFPGGELTPEDKGSR